MHAPECAARLIEALSVLEAVITAETEAASTGRIRAALDMLEAKNAAFARYRAITAAWQQLGEATRALPGDTLVAVRTRHNALARALHHNHIALTTTRSVSEDILREVSARMSRPAPAAYGPPGQARTTAPAAPITLSRSS